MYRLKTRRQLPGDDDEDEDVGRGIVVVRCCSVCSRGWPGSASPLAYAVILTGVTTALLWLGPRGAGPGHSAMPARTCTTSATGTSAPCCQRVRHRRRPDLRLAARPGLPAGAGRTLWGSGRLMVAFAVATSAPRFWSPSARRCGCIRLAFRCRRRPGDRRRHELRRLRGARARSPRRCHGAGGRPGSAGGWRSGWQ